MTVIYANWGDEDTKILKNMWEGVDTRVVELNRSYPRNYMEVDEIHNVMYEEENTIIFCGHGSPDGLWCPSSTTSFIFDKNDLPKIKAKNIIGIWCYASEFSKRYNVEGFYSYMFISNSSEARGQGIIETNENIHSSMRMFCDKINSLIKDNVNTSEWVNIIQKDFLNEKSTEVEEFNYGNLYFKGKYI